ncbi:MAG: family 78 glycoside hydrolase catalytic domain [Flavitalea sp.]
MKRIILCAFLLSFYAFASAGSPLHPGILTCEHIINPLGIDILKPRLSWTAIATQRNQRQSAYELVVSDNSNDAALGKGNIWTTGKINSSQSLNIDYNGPSLASFKRYYWSVKMYDQDGQSSGWSNPAWFETAMINNADWKGQWVDDGSVNPSREEDFYKDDRMPLFHKGFSAGRKIRSARLYISGLGYYEAYLNGKKISANVLDPGFTSYRKEVLYVTHDITSMVRKGNNVAGIMLGSGWWNPLPFKFFGRFDFKKFQQTGRPCVKAEIRLVYQDGTTENIATDASWQTAPGPVIRNNVYLGEHYDARLEQTNWNTIGAAKYPWKNASIAKGPCGELTAQMAPPIRVTKVVKPVSITEWKPGIYIADMGQNFAGVARIRVKGPTGAKVTMRYGEGLYADGSLNIMTTAATQIKKGGIKGGPGAPETAWQEDSYTLKGQGIETWSPRFTFHGFQFVEIAGWPGKPTVNDIEGLRMNSDLEQNGYFSCSNDMFNKLHEVIRWTFLSNVFSVQSDCPGREKMGYGGDIVATANSFIYGFNMANFYGKALHDFANDQQPDGGITEIAPYTGIADRGIGGESGPLGWQLAFPFMQKQLYDYYGDKRIIETYYLRFQKQLEFMTSKATENLFYWDISDHEALDPKPEALSASAFYYHHVLLGAEFAGILGKTEDAIKYAAQAKNIREAITAKYMVPGTGRFDNATESAQIFALYYGLSTEKENSKKRLMDEFERHDWHLSTGIFTTKMLFDVLSHEEMNDKAYRIANQRTFPGWGHMIDNGATTLWETWAFPEEDASRNHPMFGSILEWFYASLLGIRPAAPGFEKITIRPQPAGDLTWAKGSYLSVKGKISSEWKIDNNQFHLKVEIPANTSALVYIRSKENNPVTESGRPIGNEGMLKLLRYEKGYAVVEVGSGSYSFVSEL